MKEELNTNKGYAVFAFWGACMGIIGGMILFSSELFLSVFYAEISPKTYLLFLALYIAVGALGGTILGLLTKSILTRLKLAKLKEFVPNILPAAFLFAIFFLYGFYYINEKLTPGVGVFAPISLAANLIYFLFALATFRISLGYSGRFNNVPASFLAMSAMPLAALIALNFRFFLWQSPRTYPGLLFLAVLCFGMAGLVGSGVTRWLGRLLAKQSSLLQFVSTLAVAFVTLSLFAWSGRPSGASFQLSEPKASEQAKVPDAKNIIWIVMDTARRDQISIYRENRELTPNIDQIAKDALVFKRAISSAPWTIPSHASMFTGTFPSKHAAHRGVPGGKFTNPLSKENLTIAEILSEHGYETACIAANVAGLSRNFGFTQGFNYYFDGRPIAYSLFLGKALASLSKRFRTGVLRANEICLSSEINGLVFDWLDRRSKTQPFFLFINYMEAHDGVEHIPEPYDSMFDFDRAEYEKTFAGFQQSKVVHFEQEVTPAQFEMYEKRLARRVYFMDHNIGRLIEKLKEEGLYDDSFIIITSDHGELNGEHYSFGHNTDLYNELIWIPLIVKYPAASKTGFSDKTVQNIDIMPELLQYLGIRIPEQVQGQPFAEVSHEIIAELFEQKKAQALLYPERYYRDLRAIYTSVDGDSLKYIWASNGKSELYDMVTDSKELHNLVEGARQVAGKLDERLDQWRNGFVPVSSTNGKMKYTKEVQDRLRSLGYIK